jgi:hypothetical protein
MAKFKIRKVKRFSETVRLSGDFWSGPISCGMSLHMPSPSIETHKVADCDTNSSLKGYACLFFDAPSDDIAGLVEDWWAALVNITVDVV